MEFNQFKLSDEILKGVTSMVPVATAPIWNRLEASPRNPDSTSAFKAEVRDALWMLSRQWQLGEFIGDDAGSLAFSQLVLHCNRMDIPPQMPLETFVEQQPVFENSSERAMQLSTRLQMGHYWLKLLQKYQLQSFIPDFLNHPSYQISLPSSARPDLEAQQVAQLVSGKCLDGWIFYNDPKRFDHITGNVAPLKDAFQKMQQWYQRCIQQPATKDNPWNPAHLEYQFSVKMPVHHFAAGNYIEFELGTQEYYQGHLDWYHFEGISSKNIPASSVKNLSRTIRFPDAKNRSPIPGPVTFAGMPEKRYWAMEDAATNFAAVKPDKLDLGKMALIEFGLVYSNDWSMIPIKVPMGSLLEVEKLEVVDTFGKKTVIPAMGTSLQRTWESWKFFALNSKSTDKLNGLLFPPTVGKVQQSKPLEEVVFIRDEVANMIWGIETIVPSPMGNGIPGREAGTQPQRKSKGTTLSYQAQTQVPKNWIPFIVVQDPAHPLRVVTRRGALLDERNERIRPSTALLRQGINAANAQTTPYDIDENEIGREGVRVTKTYQRTRWHNGEVYVWLGIQKSAGKGEGNSALRFDQLHFT